MGQNCHDSSLQPIQPSSGTQNGQWMLALGLETLITGHFFDCFRHLDERTIEIIDGTLLEGWSKQLVSRKDLSKYDMYIVRYRHSIYSETARVINSPMEL